MWYFKKEIPLRDSRTIEIDGQKLTIKKYYYDEPRTYDEEEDVYFVDNKGLILTTGGLLGWYSTFDNNSNQKLIDYIVSDTTDFFRNNKRLE